MGWWREDENGGLVRTGGGADGRESCRVSRRRGRRCRRGEAEERGRTDGWGGPVTWRQSRTSRERGGRGRAGRVQSDGGRRRDEK